MRSVSTLARWLQQVRRSLGSSTAMSSGQARRERTVRRLRAQETAVDPWLAEERVLLSAPAVMLSVAAATYTENAPPVTLDPMVTANDPDADFITAAQVKIVDFEMGQDQLSFTAQFGITGSFNNMTGILSLSGLATTGNYATVLRSVQYQNLTDAPSDLTRTIEFTITDTEPATSAAATLTLNLVSVADTPANVLAAVNEDTLSAPIVLAPNPIDGATVTHFQITGITNGTLYLNDGVTVVGNGTFVTTADAALGLKFQGNADYFGPAEFKFQAAVGNTPADLGGNIATAAITVNPIADTPGNVMASVNEDTLSAPIILTPNAVDGASVTHFQITGITNGTLYLNDGVTVVNNGDFVTVADAALGLKYQGNTNYFGPAEFKFQAAVGNMPTDLGGALATATITVNPIADTPANVMAMVNEDTLSLPIVLVPNPVDGASVTHFQITGITNGTLYLNDGITVVNSGDFITVAQATAGLKYQGNANFFGPAQFQFQASTSNMVAGLAGALATASITVNPIADTPANVMATVNEDTLSAPIILTPNAVDLASVTHFQITGITNGTLYLNDGVTIVNNGDFVSVADAALGLKYQGNLNYFGPAQFQFQAAVGPMIGDLNGGIATASITVNPIADTPANVVVVVNEDTLSGPIILTPNAVDLASVTHFQITGITNGTLYLNDGVTVVNNGDFVSVADAALGLKYQGNLNYFGPAQFQFQAAVGNTVGDLGGALATASITVNPIADTPANVVVVVNEDTLSAPIVLTPNAVDLLSVTHFQITGITNGTLYLNDGVTVVNNGDFITVAQATAGLKYQGNLNYFGPAQFNFQAAVGPMIGDLNGGIATASITVNPIADTPANVIVVVNEDTLSTPIILTPNAVDLASVTHFQITGITNGTLYLNDGITMVNNGDFITVAQATAGLKYQGNLNYFGPAQFQFQAAVGNMPADLGGSLAAASITVNPIADTPANVVVVVNEDTLSAPIVLTPNAVDLLSVTHFQITGITNGTLYLNDGITVVNNGDFVTAADAALGLKYQGNLNYFGPAEFKFQAAVGPTVGNLGGAIATASITVVSVNDNPTIIVPGAQTTDEGSILALPGILIDDVDVAGNLLTVEFQTTGPTANYTLLNTAGITFLNGTNGGNVPLKIQGTLADLQAALSTLSVQPYDNGLLSLTLVITDELNGSNQATIPITVNNIAPTPMITGNMTGFEGTPINLTASSTDPANLAATALNNDSVTYAWQVLRNGVLYDTGAGTNYALTPDNEGTYQVFLIAADEDGGSTTTLQTITVANVAPTTMINATDIDGQFYTYVDIAVDDPGNDNITVTIVWGDINPNDFLNDPFVFGETATTRTFGTVTHRYLNAPNPADPLAPVTITFFINDGTDTVIQQVVVEVTEQGIPAGGVYVTPEPVQIVLPAPPAVIVPPQNLTQPAQLQVRNEELVAREETQTDEEARLVLHVVGPTGVEGPAVTLPDGLLKNLRGLFAKLPDGHYRVYLVQGESRRLVIEVFVRQGRAIDPAEADQGTQERPPQVQPAAQAEPERVMQAEPVGQAVPDKLPVPLDQNTLATESNASQDADPTTDFAEMLAMEVFTRQAEPDLQNSPEIDPETPENADQAGLLSLAAAGVVAGTGWRRTARRQRAAAATTGPEHAEKIEKTWSRLARRARQWKPR